jgi:hypothetical protein
MMKDALGNKLSAGNLVLWNGLIAKVLDVNDGRLAVISKHGAETTVPFVTLELKLSNPQPNALIRVVDPAAQSMLEQVMAPTGGGAEVS